MNNKQKNSLEYSKPQLEQFSDNTILEVLPEKNSGISSSKYVLIKHDYYSSDSDHGREMLSCFLTSLTESTYQGLNVYLVDSAVLMLEQASPLYEQMRQLIEKAETVIASNESLAYYGIFDVDCKIIKQSIKSVSEDIIYLTDLLVLE